MGSIPGSGRSPGGGHGNPSSILAWIIPWTQEPGGPQSGGCKQSEETETTQDTDMAHREAKILLKNGYSGLLRSGDETNFVTNFLTAIKLQSEEKSIIPLTGNIGTFGASFIIVTKIQPYRTSIPFTAKIFSLLGCFKCIKQHKTFLQLEQHSQIYFCKQPHTVSSFSKLFFSFFKIQQAPKVKVQGEVWGRGR